MEKSANWEIHKELKTQCRGEIDRISDLPDHLLLQVISLLPIQSAVATCILSKRWKDIWTGIKTLDLTDCSERLKSSEDYTSFKNFLDKVRLCKDASCLELVKFYLNGRIDHIHASEWIASLMKRGIKKLELSNKIENSVLNEEEIDKLLFMPVNFSTSHELVRLKLCGALLICFPASVHFPLLKVVSLFNIDLLDGGSVRNLLSGCPNLEELRIDDCAGVGNLDLYSSSMKKLDIIFSYWSVDNVVINAPNLDQLHLLELTSPFVLNAPNLRHLFLSTFSVTSYWMDNMPSLVDVFLDIGGDEIKVAETLHGVSSSKSLTLGESTILFLEDNDQGLPVYSNLTHLEVKMRSWPAVLDLLEHSPNLKHFIACFEDIEAKLEWSYPPSMPDCMLVLEEVGIQGFDGNVFILEMIQYIFRKAKFLKKIVVKVCYKLEHEIEILMQCLDMAPKVCSECEIIVY